MDKKESLKRKAQIKRQNWVGENQRAQTKILNPDYAYIPSKTTNCYAILCQKKKIYVGSSNNIQQRFSQHLLGYGSGWTKLFKGIELIQQRLNVSPFEQDKMTKQYMQKYNIINVRGGSYVQMVLEDQQIKCLTRQTNQAQGNCMYCGKSDHWIKNCPVLRKQQTLSRLNNARTDQRNKIKSLTDKMKAQVDSQKQQNIQNQIVSIKAQKYKLYKQFNTLKKQYSSQNQFQYYYDDSDDSDESNQYEDEDQLEEGSNDSEQQSQSHPNQQSSDQDQSQSQQQYKKYYYGKRY